LQGNKEIGEDRHLLTSAIIASHHEALCIQKECFAQGRIGDATATPVLFTPPLQQS